MHIWFNDKDVAGSLNIVTPHGLIRVALLSFERTLVFLEARYQDLRIPAGYQELEDSGSVPGTARCAILDAIERNDRIA